MTDKDPKDMTASELLRKADSHPCSMCHLVMAGDESCSTTGCASWAYRLADKIDAELAQVRADELRDLAAIWAKVNGWPDFRDGEDFAAWIYRCALPRPRFEDGEPVQFGDSFLRWDGKGGNDGENVVEITVMSGDYYRWGLNGDCCTSQPAKRPAPDTLGADGLPIKVGETVWNIFSGIEGIIKALNLNGESTAYVEWRDGRWSPGVRCDRLTHTPPDTQERIDEDKHKIASAYWRCESEFCSNCPSKIDGMSPMEYYGVCICDVAQGMDIARRQRELDERKGGEE